MMEAQLTIRLPAELVERLDQAAKRMQRSRSEVVRTALEGFLTGESRERPIERVRDLLGRVESGVPDLGQRHREYLAQRLRDGR